VEYESEILEMTAASVSVVDDPSMKLGFTLDYSTKYKLASADGSSPACKSRLWKVTKDGDTVSRTLFIYQDSYGAQTCTYLVSPDLKLELVIDRGSRDTMYIRLNPTYLDGTPLSWDAAGATSDEVHDFNVRMTQLMADKGIVWPYTNNGYLDDNPSGNTVYGDGTEGESGSSDSSATEGTHEHTTSSEEEPTERERP